MDDVQTLAELGSNLATIAAVLGAAIWFLYTSEFKRRVQFDVECRFLDLQNNQRECLAELLFVFENKGYVEHRLFNLNVSVHSLALDETVEVRAGTGEALFPICVVARAQLVPTRYEYFFVRPGVRQVIAHVVRVPTNISVVRVTASFDYGQESADPHTARRIFRLPPRGERACEQSSVRAGSSDDNGSS